MKLDRRAFLTVLFAPLLAPFVPKPKPLETIWWLDRRGLNLLDGRSVILKSRQVGMSTMASSLMLHRQLFMELQ